MRPTIILATLEMATLVFSTPLDVQPRDISSERGRITARTDADHLAELQSLQLRSSLIPKTNNLATRQDQLTMACRQALHDAIAPYNDFLQEIGMDEIAVIGLFVAGGLLVFGGELSDFGRRITWMTLAISVMLAGQSFCGLIDANVDGGGGAIDPKVGGGDGGTDPNVENGGGAVDSNLGRGG